MQVLSLGWEDASEKEVATHSSILAWESHGQKRQAIYAKKFSTAAFQKLLFKI